MTQQMWIRSHVERLLEQEWGASEVTVDAEGDYPFRIGTAACWVSVLDGGAESSFVRVFAHAARGVTPSLKVLREINDVNQRTTSATVMLIDGVVYVAQTISPVGLTRPVLAQAIESVGRTADDIGVWFTSMFGGDTPFPAEIGEGEEVA